MFTLSKNTNLALRKMDRAIEIFITLLFLCFTLLVCCSCGSTKAVTQLVEHTSIDTVYLSNIQYDSIYIYKDRVSEHHLGTLPPIDSSGKYLTIPTRTDTLYVKDVSIEYRYKMLRDTIYKTQVDSIPYQVNVTEVKEITRPLTWFDKASRFCFLLVIVIVIVIVTKPTIRLILKLRKL